MNKQKPTPPMTPDMIAQHLAQLQARSTSTLISSTKLPPQKRNRTKRFLIPILLVLGATITNIILYRMSANWYFIPIPIVILLFSWLTVKARSLSWTGLQGKTLWDWLQVILIPIILALYTLAMTINTAGQQTTAMQSQNHIADEQLKSEILRNYTDKIQELILDKELLQSKDGDPIRTIATTQTDLAFRQLDKNRKANLLLFISQLHLTDRSNPFINLAQVDFYGVDLSGTDLSGVNLSGADFTYANLSGASLQDANLSEADLTYANLSEAFLQDANLSKDFLYHTNLNRAYLYQANLSEADLINTNPTKLTVLECDGAELDLSGADLTSANLYQAQVTDGQLKQVGSLQGATMPDGSIHP